MGVCHKIIFVNLSAADWYSTNNIDGSLGPPEKWETSSVSSNIIAYFCVNKHLNRQLVLASNAGIFVLGTIRSLEHSFPGRVWLITASDLWARNAWKLGEVGLPKVTGQLADKPTRRQTNSPTNQIAEIDILTFRLWEQGLIFRAYGTDVLEDQKSVPENSEMKFSTMFYHCCDNRASLINVKSMLILTISLFRHSLLRG